MIIYISGAITGTPDYMERFAEAEKKLMASGKEVINPAKICSMLPQSTTWEQYMELDYLLLDMADGVYMLKGWDESKGALLEYKYAMARDKVIIHQGE